MGVYNYLLSGKKRRVAIEGRKFKSTLRLMPFGYKFMNFISDKDDRNIERLNTAAEKRADKINETAEHLRFMAKRRENIDAGKPTLRGYNNPPNLVVHADSWDEVRNGDPVYIYEGNGSWIDTVNYAEAFGFIVGKKGNGQFIIGDSYETEVNTSIYCDGSTSTWFRKHILVKEKDYVREDKIRRPERIYHTEERIELSSTPAPEPEVIPEPELVSDVKNDPIW